jgi:hypothetical protein
MSEQSILSVLHPNAKELFDAGRSLSELCQSIASPRSEESSFNVKCLDLHEFLLFRQSNQLKMHRASDYFHLVFHKVASNACLLI